MTNTTFSTEKSISSKLEFATKVLALAATAAVALSVIFDWGYLSALDLTLFEVPTSLADHARSAILWIPMGVIVLVVLTVIILFLENRQTRKQTELDKSDFDLEQSEWQYRKYSIALIVICLVLWIAFGDRATTFLSLAILMTWANFVRASLPLNGVHLRIKLFLRIGLIVLPATAGILFIFGYSLGTAAIAQSHPYGSLVLKKNSGYPERISANIIRSFENFHIVQDAQKKLLILKPEEIILVEPSTRVSENHGLLCSQWQFICPKDTSTPPLQTNEVEQSRLNKLKTSQQSNGQAK